MSTPTLRDYQADAVAAILAKLQEHDGVIYCAPTASGKTVVAANLINHSVAGGLRVLVVTHRKEILEQTEEKLKAEGVTPGLIAHGYHMDKAHPVLVAMVMSLRSRRDGVQPELIVFDECHHIRAPSWERVTEWFPSAKRLGLSATPQRHD
jgi:DNA repair protein RadD